MPRAQGCAGAACVSLARRLLIGKARQSRTVCRGRRDAQERRVSIRQGIYKRQSAPVPHGISNIDPKRSVLNECRATGSSP